MLRHLSIRDFVIVAALDLEFDSGFTVFSGETGAGKSILIDALALALPAQLTCRPDCAGLCPQCGANLNEDPEHSHEAAPSSRWAKLSELKFD